MTRHSVVVVRGSQRLVQSCSMVGGQYCDSDLQPLSEQVSGEDVESAEVADREPGLESRQSPSLFQRTCF